MNADQIAQTCHAANSGYRAANGQSEHASWSDLEGASKAGAVKAIQFIIANPDCSPGVIHDAWMKSKVDAGWTYGTEEDKELKTSPNLVAFDRLPLAEQKKDKLFLAIVKALM